MNRKEFSLLIENWRNLLSEGDVNSNELPSKAAFERAFYKVYTSNYNKNYSMVLNPTGDIRNWTFTINNRLNGDFVGKEKHTFHDLVVGDETIDQIKSKYDLGEYNFDDLKSLFVQYFESIECKSNDHSAALEKSASDKSSEESEIKKYLNSFS